MPPETIEQKVQRLEQDVKDLKKAIVEILMMENDRFTQASFFEICWKIHGELNKP